MASGVRRASYLLSTELARVIRIEKMITHASVTFADLQSSLGCSRATLRRDLRAMREELGAPVVFDRFSNGYRIAQQWPGIVACLMEQALQA